MKLVAVMPVRNEDWVLGLSLRACLRWCDAAVVLNHASTDGTARILDEISAENDLDRVNVLHENNPVWEEMAHRQRLLDGARALGATHIAIVDADEVLSGNLLPVIRGRIEQLRPGEYASARMFAMWRGIDHYRDDASIWSNRDDLALAFCDSPMLAWRANNGYDHHHREPYGVRLKAIYRDGGAMHLQFSDWRRLCAKQVHYKLTERVRWQRKPVRQIDQMYSLAMREDGLRVAPAPDEWWAPWRDLLCHLRLDAEPWQESECRRIVAGHERNFFRGLNMHGVV